MLSISSDASGPRGREDGFERIPVKPKRAYLLRANPVLDHLPTRLATRKHDVWRLPLMLHGMSHGDVVVLWQAGPEAGIYGIAVPYGESFATSGWPQYAKGSQNYHYVTHSIKLQYIYVLAKPLLTTAVNFEKIFHKTSIRRELWAPVHKSWTGVTLDPSEWKKIYKLLKDSRENSIAEYLPIDIATTTDSMELETLAHQVWPILAHAAGTNSPLHRRDLSEQFNVSSSEMQNCLELIDNICDSENWPSLASIVRSSDPLATSSELSAPNVLSIAQFQSMSQQANNFTNVLDWTLMPNPFDFVLQSTTDQLVRRLVENPSPEESAAVYKLVKVRGSAQMVFAKMMRRIYDNQCAFCGFSVAPALEAAHIKPWPMCTPAERLLPTNGLLLCAVHHKLFDSGLMSLSDRHVVKVVSPESLTCIAKADDQYVLDVDGTAAHMPLDRNLRPSPEFLKCRRELVARIFGSRAFI